MTRVRDYEAAQGFDLPGCYGGIEPSSENTGSWVRYLLGEAYPEDNEPSNGITWLLGCNCSVAGCWPLEARVTVERDRVIWNGFRQPHRPAQDYTAFKLPPGERAVLIVCAQYPDGATREQITILAGYKRSTRDAYIQRLVGKDYVSVSGNLVRPTGAGIVALGDDFQPLPTGEALQDYWLARLPEGERKILDVLVASKAFWIEYERGRANGPPLLFRRNYEAGGGERPPKRARRGVRAAR